MDRRTVTAGWLLTGKSTRGYPGRKAGRHSGVGIFLGGLLRGPVPGSRHPRPLRLADPTWAAGQQAGGAHRPGTEPGHRRVGRALRLRPAVLPAVERELAGRALGLDQALDAHPEKPDPVAGPQYVIERPSRLKDFVSHVGGRGE